MNSFYLPIILDLEKGSCSTSKNGTSISQDIDENYFTATQVHIPDPDFKGFILRSLDFCKLIPPVWLFSLQVLIKNSLTKYSSKSILINTLSYPVKLHHHWRQYSRLTKCFTDFCLNHYQFDFRLIDLKTMKVLVVPRGSADIEGEEVIDGGCSRVCCSELSLLESSNERILNFIV